MDINFFVRDIANISPSEPTSFCLVTLAFIFTEPSINIIFHLRFLKEVLFQFKYVYTSYALSLLNVYIYLFGCAGSWLHRVDLLLNSVGRSSPTEGLESQALVTGTGWRLSHRDRQGQSPVSSDAFYSYASHCLSQNRIIINKL